MADYQKQGEGALVPGRGAKIVSILANRGAKRTRVLLDNGDTSFGANWSWGRDIGAAWEHLYFVEDGLDFFLSTEHVVSLSDPETGELLFSRDSK